jgi:hypothetical protein
MPHQEPTMERFMRRLHYAYLKDLILTAILAFLEDSVCTLLKLEYENRRMGVTYSAFQVLKTGLFL